MSLVFTPSPNATDERIVEVVTRLLGSDPAQHELTDAIIVPRSEAVRRGQATGKLDPMIPSDFAEAVFPRVVPAAREAVAIGTMMLGAAHADAVRVLVSSICADPRPARS